VRFFREREPFPYWLGPYSPSRGKYFGFRIKNGQLGAWIKKDCERSFCFVKKTQGVSDLATLVQNNWYGGRILFLPGGLIVKPLQNEDESGRRVVVGRYAGGFEILTENGIVDLALGRYTSGSEWPGLGTIGLECVIDSTGALSTKWQRPSDYGQERYEERITSPNPTLIAGFKKARPYETSGRVRVTVCGHVTTNRKVQDDWKTFYIGKIELSSFAKWDHWIQRR